MRLALDSKYLSDSAMMIHEKDVGKIAVRTLHYQFIFSQGFFSHLSYSSKKSWEYQIKSGLFAFNYAKNNLAYFFKRIEILI